MKSLVGITTDLADVFFIQALKEGYCDYMLNNTKEKRNEFANYMFKKGNYTNESYSMNFDRLSHLLMLYDEVAFPIFDQGFLLHGGISEVAQIKQIMPYYFYTNRQLDIFELSDEQAMSWKPIIMNAVKKVNFFDYYDNFARKRAGSIENYISMMFDHFYKTNYTNKDIYYEMLDIDCRILDGEMFDYICDESCVLYTKNLIINLVKNLRICLKFNENGNCDFYSKMFDDFSTSTDVNNAYEIVKLRISNILTLQPAFSSLSQILKFRSKKKNAIKNLRNEISAIENILRTGGKEAAIKQAIRDVKLANEELIKGSATKKVAQIATYISVPIGLAELVTFGSSFSILISVVGTMAQLKIDRENESKDWLFIAR